MTKKGLQFRVNNIYTTSWDTDRIKNNVRQLALNRAKPKPKEQFLPQTDADNCRKEQE